MIQIHPIYRHANHSNSNRSCPFKWQFTIHPYNTPEFWVLRLQQDSCVSKKKYLSQLRYRTSVSFIPCRRSHTHKHTLRNTVYSSNSAQTESRRLHLILPLYLNVIAVLSLTRPNRTHVLSPLMRIKSSGFLPCYSEQSLKKSPTVILDLSFSRGQQSA